MSSNARLIEHYAHNEQFNEQISVGCVWALREQLGRGEVPACGACRRFFDGFVTYLSLHKSLHNIDAAMSFCV